MKFSVLFIGSLLSVSQVLAQTFSQQSFQTVNTQYDEINPIISPDGKTLYFTIAHHPENVGGKKDSGDIWISIRLGDQWSGAVNAGHVLNSSGFNAVGGFSSDGNAMYLLSHYEKIGKVKTQGISVSRKTEGGGWTFPENITIPYFLNRSETLLGTITDDGRTFIFSADGYNSRGNEDIYVCGLQSTGEWSEPMNLGATINTSFQELAPSISSDARILYFSSNGRQGYGSFDVFYSERIDGTWTNWSEPINMGASVNSEGRELSYRPYPKNTFALFTSTINSDGYGDVKVGNFTQEQTLSQVIVADSSVKLVEIIRERPTKTEEKIIVVRGNVVNAKSRVPLTATLDFHADHNYKVASVADGSYTITLPSVNQYSIHVAAPGFVGALEKLDVRTYEMKDLQLDFELLPIEVGTTVNLKSVLFFQSTSDLLPESLEELDMVVDFMKANPKVEIDLAGHTDNRGIHTHNVRLSQDRVDKVKRYLADKGIESKRISGKGYGGIKPIADNDAEESRKLNRRVEFTIVKMN